jgi:nucleotide-binding universal stress UspA family protein
MSFAAVMVHVDAQAPCEARVRLAATLARKFDAVLIGLGALAIPPTRVAEGESVEEVAEADARTAAATLAERGHWFRGIVAGEVRAHEWRPVFDFANPALAREARSADIVVIGRAPDGTDPRSALDPAAAVLTLGRPALVVPERVSSLRAERIVIGWKDAREARRAVIEALPLLQTAGQVSIAEITGSGDSRAALDRMEDVARHLQRHRVNVGARIFQEPKGPIGAQMVRIAEDERADLIVVGAYGHSRLGEWVFGGMTQELLAKCPLCCLMSH